VQLVHLNEQNINNKSCVTELWVLKTHFKDFISMYSINRSPQETTLGDSDIFLQSVPKNMATVQQLMWIFFLLFLELTCDKDIAHWNSKKI